MKTLAQINTLIEKIVDNFKDLNLDKKQKEKVKKNLELLRLVKLYLETNPKEGFILKELKRLSTEKQTKEVKQQIKILEYIVK